LGGRRFIGNPKQPTLTVCTLVDGEYELRLFRGNDRVVSPLLPEMGLTAAQVLMLDEIVSR
jgi:Uma2 family endonuclease